MIRYAHDNERKLGSQSLRKSERKSCKEAAILPIQNDCFIGGRDGVVIRHGVWRPAPRQFVVF